MVDQVLQGWKPIRESSESTKESDAKKLLKLREGDAVRGIPVTPRINRIMFQELANDVINDYNIVSEGDLIAAAQRLDLVTAQ